MRSQGELVRALQRRGVQATQATVSRDLKELGAVRTVDDDGGARYVLQESLAASGRERSAANLRSLRRVLRSSVLEILEPQALLVVRTPSGFANAVAAAVDDADIEGVVATLAGDDTILLVVETPGHRRRVLERLRELADDS